MTAGAPSWRRSSTFPNATARSKASTLGLPPARRIRPRVRADPTHNLSVLGLPGLPLGRAGIIARARVSHHAHGLNLDFDTGPSEIRHGDEGTARIVSVLEEICAHFHEFVAVAGFLDEHGHGYQLVYAPACQLHAAVEFRIEFTRLAF